MAVLLQHLDKMLCPDCSIICCIRFCQFHSFVLFAGKHDVHKSSVVRLVLCRNALANFPTASALMELPTLDHKNELLSQSSLWGMHARTLAISVHDKSNEVRLVLLANASTNCFH